MEYDFDVIVVGGGPAGLSVASELAKEHDILLIEKGAVAKTTKSWFVPRESVEKNKDIQEFFFGSVERFLAKTFTGGNLLWGAKEKRQYPYVKGNKLLKYWADNILLEGSSIFENCSYEGHQVVEGGVLVETTLGGYTAKLIIDASGDNSPILAEQGEAPDMDYWWSVFGCIGKHSKGLDNSLQVGDYMLWQTFANEKLKDSASLGEGRPVFEYEILDKETSFPLILYLRKKKMSYDEMKNDFLKIIRQEKETEAFHNIDIEEFKFGWYPSGGKPGYSLDRVAFVGTSGAWATPCGWGMGYILNNYKSYAKVLSRKIKVNELGAESLASIASTKGSNEYQRVLNRIIMRFLAESSTVQVDRFIEVFNQINPHICESMFTMKINREEITEFLKVVLKTFDLKELLSIFTMKDFVDIGKITGTNLLDAFQDRVLRRQTQHKRKQGEGFLIAQE